MSLLQAIGFTALPFIGSFGGLFIRGKTSQVNRQVEVIKVFEYIRQS
jgi:hypothetical protein